VTDYDAWLTRVPDDPWMPEKCTHDVAPEDCEQGCAELTPADWLEDYRDHVADWLRD
jgi:hypothetical protein